MRELVTKAVFLEALACRTKGWRLHRVERAEPGADRDYETQFRTWQGNEIHTRARAALGDGLLLRSGDVAASARAAAAAIADPALPVVFEATVTAHDCVARADALRRDGDGWELIEVKSAKTPEDGKPPREYVDDLAFTLLVAEGAGLTIRRATLMLVNRDYRLELDGAQPLFGFVDATHAARRRAQEFRAVVADVTAAVLGAREPEPTLILACRSCEYFGVDCLGVGIPDPLFDLPRLSQKKLDELRPYARIRNVPRDADLTPPQRRVAEAVWQGQALVDAATLAALEGLAHPLLFLDFESMATAVPLFTRTMPHQQVVFQYSLHVVRAPGADPEHRAFLADEGTDWREALFAQLRADLGDAGTILSYSSFEAQVIRGLGQMLPHNADACEALVARIFDLEPVVREGWVHPDFHGRSSIKKVLPVVDPALDYGDLAIGDGGAASSAFALMHAGKLPRHEHAALRASLLTYCQRDTLAMVKVYDALRSLPR